MKNVIISLPLVVTSFVSLPAFAQDDTHQISSSVAFLTDYLYRGISQTNENFAVQGSIDYSHAPTGLYAGAWASNVDFAESTEFNYYGGIAGEFDSGLSWDVGGLWYSYSGSNALPEEDFFEMYSNVGYAFSDMQLTPFIGAGIAYAPDFFGEDGDSIYLHGNLDLSLPHDFDLSFYAGYQDVEGDKLTGPDGYSYVHYSVGLTKNIGSLGLSVSWNDADDDCDGGTNELCQAVVFSVSRSF